METLVLTLLSALTLSVYVGICLWKWGVPRSISATWYTIGKKWGFSIAVILACGMLFPVLLDVLPLWAQFLAFLFSTSGIFVGFAPNLDDDLEESVHTSFAILLSLCAVLIVGILDMWIFIPFLAAVVIVIAIRGWERFKGEYKFWLEIIGGGAVYLVLLTEIVKELCCLGELL